MKLFTYLALVIALLSPAAHAAEDSELFTQIYRDEWVFRAREFPQLASEEGEYKYPDRLTHVSEADQKRRYEYWKTVEQKLESISCDELERVECINFRIFKRQIDQYIANYETRAYLIPFNSDWGFYVSWARMAEASNFTQADDWGHYLARLEELPVVMDQYIDLMREGIRIGMTQPRVVLDGRDKPMLAQIVSQSTDSPYFEPFRSLPESMPKEEQAAMLKQADKVLSEGVIPAYQRLVDFFHNEYVPGARATLGATELPDGARFYQDQIRLYATVEMTPDEIHQIGLSEVARIRAEMETIIQQVEFEGSFADFIEFLRTDPQFYASSPKELLAEASYFAKKADGRMPLLFGHLPRQPYGVAPVPEDLAPFFTAGRYVGASIDAHRGGYYWVNTYALESRTLYTLPALTLHEAAPGHHTQSALAKEQGEQPPFRRSDYISAYGEGWALYAEKLGVEMDIYETPYQDFGRLTYEMWRACRLVIDTGVHAKGWSRQQALDYLSSNTALSIHEITTEIDRYISWPAQALSYKLGEYTIWELRRGAEATLGDAFDLRAFHDFVLSLGSVPLDVLRDEVARWVSTQA